MPLVILVLTSDTIRICKLNLHPDFNYVLTKRRPITYENGISITYNVMIVTIMIILKWVTHDACAAITKKRYLFRKIQLYLFELRIWSFFVRKNLL